MKQVLIVAALVASASAFAPASRCVRSFALIVATLILKFVSRVLPLVDIENNDNDCTIKQLSLFLYGLVLRRWNLDTLQEDSGLLLLIPGFFFLIGFLTSFPSSVTSIFLVSLLLYYRNKINYFKKKPINRPITTTTALSAEWEKEWKDSNFEGDLAKVQKEAEDRLEEKVAELLSNIENTGAN